MKATTKSVPFRGKNPPLVKKVPIAGCEARSSPLCCNTHQTMTTVINNHHCLISKNTEVDVSNHNRWFPLRNPRSQPPCQPDLPIKGNPKLFFRKAWTKHPLNSPCELKRRMVIQVNLYKRLHAPLRRTTSVLTTTTLTYAIGAGITAAAGTRLALQLILDKGFKLFSFQLSDLKSPTLLFIVTTSLCQDWVIYAPAAFLGCGSRF